MAQDKSVSNKRKGGPEGCKPGQQPHKKPRFAAAKDARAIALQTSFKAFKHGELNVDHFVRSRQFEIQALEQGLTNSKKALTSRAFQLVPKELRRRTASHNAKRVPKRLRDRAKREMKEDNTPVVTSRRRKPSSHLRLREETAKKLRALAASKRLANSDRAPTSIATRAAKIKNATLAVPPVPKAKFKKRQINKSWLPTHLFHAKRARMTPPKEPLWRFAIPLTPTQKSYRPTHRAAMERGVVAFDMSYMSTICLTGRYHSLLGILHAVDRRESIGKLRTAHKWRMLRGEAAVALHIYHRDSPCSLIAPATVIWQATPEASASNTLDDLDRKRTSLLVRVHPSAFLETWEELIRVSKIVKPAVTVQDLRYEIGSIELVGPASTETLVSVLNACCAESDACIKRLHSMTKTASLPVGSIIDTQIKDPRLCAKSRCAPQAVTSVQLLAWSMPGNAKRGMIFDKQQRTTAASRMPSQKAINRRRTLAKTRNDPVLSTSDPAIPALAYTEAACNETQSKWTLLLPWKCLLPVWYALMYLPLSTGYQPRLGGLHEIRELNLEFDMPWFPADYPATQAGWQWELCERKRLHNEWTRRPKSKRVNWETLDLGHGQKGELGYGWACDWTLLIKGKTSDLATTPPENEASRASADKEATLSTGQDESFPWLTDRVQSAGLSEETHGLCQVRIDQVTRGVSRQCARIYRLPRTGDLRARWLQVHPKYIPARNTQQKIVKISKDAPQHLKLRQLAQSLLQPPQPGAAEWPPCPGAEDLIGFVTSGNYDLGSGRGTAIGSILETATVGDATPELQNLCVVRNSGQTIARLAEWRLI